MEPLLVDYAEAYEAIGCKKSTLLGYIRTGDLHPIRHGTRGTIAAEELREFVARKAEQAGVAPETVAAIRQPSSMETTTEEVGA
jgi:hypothetical protein